MDYPHQIPIRRGRYALLAVISGLFVALGFFLIFADGPNPVRGGDWFGFITGLLSILFFGACLFTFLYQLRRAGRGGLTIDTAGLHVHHMARPFRIRWEDIEGFEPLRVATEAFITVYVSNPEEYIAQTPGTLLQKTMRANERVYGSPLSIPISALATDPDDLLDLLNEELADYRALPEDLRVRLDRNRDLSSDQAW